MERKISGVRLTRYGENRWTVHVLYNDGSSTETKKMPERDAKRLADDVRDACWRCGERAATLRCGCKTRSCDHGNPIVRYCATHRAQWNAGA